jgi:hypothetical protein
MMKHYHMKLIQSEHSSLYTQLKWKLVGLNSYILGQQLILIYKP